MGALATCPLRTLQRRGILATASLDGELLMEPRYRVIKDIVVMRLVRDHKAEILKAIQDPCNSQILWVATDLDSFEDADPRFGLEAQLLPGGPIYRQLDAAYFAWLHIRMQNAGKAHKTGRLDTAAYEALKSAFKIIHAWATTHVGIEALRAALALEDAASYTAPSEITYQAEKFRDRMLRDGRVSIRSTVLGGERVMFVGSRAEGTQPSDLLTFSVQEARLVAGATPEDLRTISAVKQTFGGMVLTPEAISASLPQWKQGELGVATAGVSTGTSMSHDPFEGE